MARRIREEATDDWDDKVAVDRFTGKGGTFVRGYGTIVGPGRVSVGDTVYEGSRGIVISTGTAASIPPIDGPRRHAVLDQPGGDRVRRRCRDR